jgi:TolB-like protein
MPSAPHPKKFKGCRLPVGVSARVIALLIVLFLTPPDLIAASPSPAAARDTIQRIAVYPFIPDGTEKMAHDEFLPEWISQSLAEFLSEAVTIEVLERSRIDTLLRELSLGSGELADADTRLRLGRLLGVDYFVFGSFLPVGEQLRVSAHLTSTTSGMVVLAADSEGERLQVEAIARRLSDKLLDGLGRHQQAETRRDAESMPRPSSEIPETMAPSDAEHRDCPGGKRWVFIVSDIENRVEDDAWEDRLIAVGLVDLIHEAMFATGCYLPADTNEEARQMIEDLVVSRWTGKAPSAPLPALSEGAARGYDAQVQLAIKSFDKSRSRFMLGPFSKGKVTVTVVVELTVKHEDGIVLRAEGSGEGVTRSKSVGFQIRDDKVHFDESSVGIAVHEAIKKAVGNLMEGS